MTTVDVRDLNSLVREKNAGFVAARKEIQKVIVGQQPVIDALLMALLTKGHILLEGLPGLAKTLAITTLAKVAKAKFSRIQFTPDLLPADLVGTSIYSPRTQEFFVEKGPIFANFVLADEINRAPAKVQSALLEAMSERQVTIAKQTYLLDDPFLVLATQNPIEQEGTYRLPEAQTDRFSMKVVVGYPSAAEEKEILARMAAPGIIPSVNPILTTQDIAEASSLVNEIYMDEKLTDYALSIIFATRSGKEAKLIETGASCRASLCLVRTAKAHAFLNGRGFVTPHDVKACALPVLRHRIGLSYEAEGQNLTADKVLQRILDTLPVP